MSQPASRCVTGALVPDLREQEARRHPLIPRGKPPCPPLTRRLDQIRTRASTFRLCLGARGRGEDAVQSGGLVVAVDEAGHRHGQLPRHRRCGLGRGTDVHPAVHHPCLHTRPEITGDLVAGPRLLLVGVHRQGPRCGA
jgi:hypothetical protein